MSARRAPAADRRAALAAIAVPCTSRQLSRRLGWTTRRTGDVLAALAGAGLARWQRERLYPTGPLEDVWRPVGPG